MDRSPPSLDATSVFFFLAREDTQPRLSWKISDRSETPLPQQKTILPGPAAALADAAQFAKLIRRLHRHDCVVYAKPAFGAPVQVLRYLGRYTHGVAISNQRLLAFEQERVTCRWKNCAHGGTQGQMTLACPRVLGPLLSAAVVPTKNAIRRECL
jgi:hypothetical protein